MTIEGLEFELDAILPDELVAAIRADATELTIRGCSFRRTNSRDGRNVAAVWVRTLVSQTVVGERPPAVVADTCHFDGGQTAILTEGPADIVLRDSTMGPGQPSIWFDNTRSKASVPGELHLVHTSALADAGPVFRFDGSQVRVWIDDSVIAGAGRSSATLVRIDDPRDMTWRGRSNLYGNIGIYMAFSDEAAPQEPIVDFPHWKETATELRETGTMVATSSVWEAADPGLAQASETDNPTRNFVLNSSIAARGDFGARRGPFGSVLRNVKIADRSGADDDDLLAASPRGTGRDSLLPRSSGEPPSGKDAKNPVPDPMPVVAEADDPAPSPEDPMSLPAMPPVTSDAPVAQTTPAASAAGSDSAHPTARPAAGGRACAAPRSIRTSRCARIVSEGSHLTMKTWFAAPSSSSRCLIGSAVGAALSGSPRAPISIFLRSRSREQLLTSCWPSRVPGDPGCDSAPLRSCNAGRRTGS